MPAPKESEACPACGRALDPDRVRRVGDVDRYSCLGCGLQLVRRSGEDWGQIRG